MTDQMQALTARAPGLRVLAVREDGRRSRTAPAFDLLGDAAADWLRAAGQDALVVLDHAGPRAAAWSLERAVGAAEAPEALTGRTPRALTDDGWRAVTAAFASVARACDSAGVRWALGLDDDGLLHDALRHAPARAHEVVRACAPTCVVMPVEDLAPGGLDATDGVELARALVRGGVTRLIGSGGARALGPLRMRAKGDTAGAGAALVAAAASAAWLVGRVDAPVEALVPHVDVEPSFADDVARSYGLARVWIEHAAVDEAAS